MSFGAVSWKSEEEKSLRDLSVSLESFAESQAQIKSIFSLFDHDTDGLLTSNQTELLLRKLGYSMPSSWVYLHRDAVTLPLVRLPITYACVSCCSDKLGLAVCAWTIA